MISLCIEQLIHKLCLWFLIMGLPFKANNIYLPKITTVKLGVKELFGHPKIVP
jgi:hypothetical protein